MNLVTQAVWLNMLIWSWVVHEPRAMTLIARANGEDSDNPAHLLRITQLRFRDLFCYLKSQFGESVTNKTPFSLRILAVTMVHMFCIVLEAPESCMFEKQSEQPRHPTTGNQSSLIDRCGEDFVTGEWAACIS